LLVDLNLFQKNALVIAKTDEAEIRAKQLIAESANVTVLTIDPASKELRHANTLRKLSLLSLAEVDWRSILRELHPFLAVISTGNPLRDEKIAEYARTTSSLVYVVDRPNLNGK
jgi:siroheme synthase (precorrin-2 oxidase/ferrochelatase)